jgi:hypothetical protein
MAATPAKGPRRTPSDEEEKYPNLAASRAWDEAQHVRKAEEAGLSHKKAVRHAAEEVRED